MYKTVIFFLSRAGDVRPVGQEHYARLLRGEGVAPEYAGQTVRVADWYVEAGAGEVRNETYSLLGFNAEGRAVPPGGNGEGEGGAYCPPVAEAEAAQPEGTRGSNLEVPWLPSEAERLRMRSLLA